MIYYTDTEKFFDKYEEYIYDLLVEYGMDDKLDALFELTYMEKNGMEYDGEVDKNWFAWFGFEAVAFDLANEMECA